MIVKASRLMNGSPPAERAGRAPVDAAMIGAERRARRKAAMLRWIVRVVTLAVLLMSWQVAGSRVNPLFLATPTKVAQSLSEMIKNGQLVNALGSSLKVLAIGLLLSIAIGLPVGILMGRLRLLETILEPYVNALYVAPQIALVPLILIWFGIGEESQVAVIFLTSVFPILISSYSGARGVNVNWLETARSLGASDWQRFIYVIIPGAVPLIVTGLRLGVSQALIGMVVAQMLLAQDGLGELLVNFGDQFNTAGVLAVLVVICTIGVLLVACIRTIEKRLANWVADEG